MENNIHNDFFISTMKNAQNASDFLWGVLPDNIKSKIDLKRIEYDDTSYIQKRFKKLFSDIVIKTKLNDSDLDIYMLIEHKSSLPDKNSLFLQILSYIYSMFEQDNLSGKEFRVIIPLVFYHGTGKWEIPQFFQDLFDVDSEIRKYILNFGYILYNTIDFKEDKKELFHNNLLLISSLTALKTAFNKNDTDSLIKIISDLNNIGMLKDFAKIEIILIYLLKTRNIEEKEIVRIISKYDNEGGKKMETLAEYFTEIGIQKGEEIGIEKGERIGIEKGERIGIEKGERIGIEKGERIGIEKGEIYGKQKSLIKLMNKKFRLSEEEIKLIESCNSVTVIDQALEDILFFDKKEDILKHLK